MKKFAACWGVGGFLAILGFAIYRLFPISLDAFNSPFSALQWGVFAANILFMAYSEGYKGFQMAYSPRVAARARYLLKHASLKQTILAPLFCMGYFDAPKRRRIAAFVLLIMIVALVILFRFLPQPWRGILDAGVVVGLTWGMIATIIYAIKALTSRTFKHDPQVPGYRYV